MAEHQYQSIIISFNKIQFMNQTYITIVIGIAGWYVVHYLTSRRDRVQRRRQLSTEHLINAYRVLTNEISHRSESKERSTKLENILSDIQLFGSFEQVELARALADKVAAGGEFQLDPLINSLRNDLRRQLRLQPVQGNVRWLRFKEEPSGLSEDKS